MEPKRKEEILKAEISADIKKILDDREAKLKELEEKKDLPIEGENGVKAIEPESKDEAAVKEEVTKTAELQEKPTENVVPVKAELLPIEKIEEGPKQSLLQAEIEEYEKSEPPTDEKELNIYNKLKELRARELALDEREKLLNNRELSLTSKELTLDMQANREKTVKELIADERTRLFALVQPRMP